MFKFDGFPNDWELYGIQIKSTCFIFVVVKKVKVL